MNFTSTAIHCHKTGDIVLTKSRGIGSLIVKEQKRRYKKQANYSHVLICLFPGIFVEATKGRLVDAFLYTDKNRSLAKATRWQVIRNDIVCKNEEMQEKIIETIYYQIGKSYDIHGLINRDHKLKSISNKDSGTVICSEFVALVYQQINDTLGCSLFEKPANSIIPADFETLTADRDSGWTVVNEQNLIDDLCDDLVNERHFQNAQSILTNISHLKHISATSNNTYITLT